MGKATECAKCVCRLVCECPYGCVECLATKKLIEDQKANTKLSEDILKYVEGLESSYKRDTSAKYLISMIHSLKEIAGYRKD
jgi:hypothetical protein